MKQGAYLPKWKELNHRYMVYLIVNYFMNMEGRWFTFSMVLTCNYSQPIHLIFNNYLTTFMFAICNLQLHPSIHIQGLFIYLILVREFEYMRLSCRFHWKANTKYSYSQGSHVSDNWRLKMKMVFFKLKRNNYGENYYYKHLHTPITYSNMNYWSKSITLTTFHTL